ncbi:hypothetical protein QM574_20260 [Pantoea ananatis]|uniref:hypothetical protein n=1 Tax=Pantoea ananas TaxID=553 RepID=UPI0024B7BDE4|nr:hypothetical protein [Pantoea ananatis]MDJ0046889.1 hypothetical protein [Pantoea ananatis]
MSESNDSDEVLVDIKSEKTCFIIMPIADMDGYEPGHFLRVYNHIIKPACEKSGFKVVRADDVTASNFIVLDILKKIVECDLAICDLSGRNPNVMYELGLRQAFNKKTVLIKDNKTASPFDVQAFRYCEYDSLLRIDNAQKNVQFLSKAIDSTYSHDENDVNSVVQLLKIQPAQVGEKTILSQENTLILQAIKELEEKLKPLNQKNTSKSKFKNTGYSLKGEDLETQLTFYSISQLTGNWYSKNGNELGILEGTIKDRDGKTFYKFSNGKNSYTIPIDSPELAFIIDDGIPF